MTKHIINPKNLVLIVEELTYRLLYADIKELFQSFGIIKDFTAYKESTVTEVVTEALNILSASGEKANHKLLFKAIEEMLNQLSFKLDDENFKKLEHELQIMLFHDKLYLYKNKIYSPEENLMELILEKTKDTVNKSLELYVKKKIVTEADYIDDLPYEPSMLSFNNNTFSQIVSILEDLHDRNLIRILGNTTEEFFTKGHDINWKLIKDFDNNPQKLDDGIFGIDTACFPEEDTEDDEGKEIVVSQQEELLKEVNEEITKFIYDEKKVAEESKEIWKRFGYCDEKNETKYIKQHEGKSNLFYAYNFYPYRRQKEIIINKILRLYDEYRTEQIVISFNSIKDPNIDLLRTICALEYEGLIEMLQLGNYKRRWTEKDDIFVRLIADISKLKEALSKPEQKIEIADPEKTQKVSLKDIEISFNPDDGNGSGELILGTKIISLGTETNQCQVCKFMFDEEREPDKLYPWDEVYEKTFGIEYPDRKYKKTISNAIDGLNKKVQLTLNTNDELFTWKNKSVKRNK